MASDAHDTSQLWTSDSTQYLAVEYDDTHLVYFKPSGDTHFLNFLSYGMVDTLSTGPLSEPEIFQAMLTRFSLSAQELPKDLITTTLDELDQAGLVATSSPGA